MKAITFFLLIILTTLSGRTECQETTGDAPAEVYFIRAKSLQGAAIAYRIFADDEMICKLNNNRYTVHQLSPDTKTISVQFKGGKIKKKTIRIDVELESEKTYYFGVCIKNGAFVNRPILCQAEKDEAEDFMKVSKLDDKCF
ncbi:DUF2846 domain-containing protein [Saprospiraceae bacterium]|nr:DUF2846 domain-containing protein [Saprospiraceae bacterium]